MANLTDAADLVLMKQTLAYFKKLGFSDKYVKEIERDLSEHKQKLAEILRDENK